MPHSLRSYPRAILHIDGDCFFVSCEVALHPELKGKPVVTGKERGIASSLSYEAKALGVKRGMMLSEIKKLCPDVIILPSDYETYSLFSKRMFNIVRRYTPEVDEYSIDECFADLTGMRRQLRMSYETMAENIKRDLDNELGMTFSVGLGPNKVIAKIGSKWKKPSGLTTIPANRIHLYTKNLPVEKIWGIGPQTTAYLNKLGIRTALEFSLQSEEWVKDKLSKPYYEIWQELRGEMVYSLNLEEKHDYQSISKTKTFTPPSKDKEFILSQLSKNVENACIKARRHSLATKKVYFFLKTQDFKYSGLELKLSTSVSIPQEILRMIRGNFEDVYRLNTLYRATGIVLMDLDENTSTQMDLFGGTAQIETWKKVFEKIDEIDAKYGKHSVYLGTSFKAMNNHEILNDRGDTSIRSKNLLKGKGSRQRLAIPMLGNVK